MTRLQQVVQYSMSLFFKTLVSQCVKYNLTLHYIRRYWFSQSCSIKQQNRQPVKLPMSSHFSSKYCLHCFSNLKSTTNKTETALVSPVCFSHCYTNITAQYMQCYNVLLKCHVFFPIYLISYNPSLTYTITCIQKPLIFNTPVAGTPGHCRWDPKRQPSLQQRLKQKLAWR